jgi:hypothetical protein
VATGRPQAWRHLGSIPHRELGVVMSAADVQPLPFSQRTIKLGRYPNQLGDYLAAAISQLFDNPGHSQSIGERARQLATGPLSWSTLAERVECFYMTLTG